MEIYSPGVRKDLEIPLAALCTSAHRWILFRLIVPGTYGTSWSEQDVARPRSRIISVRSMKVRWPERVTARRANCEQKMHKRRNFNQSDVLENSDSNVIQRTKLISIFVHKESLTIVYNVFIICEIKLTKILQFYMSQFLASLLKALPLCVSISTLRFINSHNVGCICYTLIIVLCYYPINLLDEGKVLITINYIHL